MWSSIRQKMAIRAHNLDLIPEKLVILILMTIPNKILKDSMYHIYIYLYTYIHNPEIWHC